MCLRSSQHDYTGRDVDFAIPAVTKFTVEHSGRSAVLRCGAVLALTVLSVLTVRVQLCRPAMHLVSCCQYQPAAAFLECCLGRSRGV